MRVISVDEYNAFGVNTVGLQGAPFPLSMSAVESERLWTIHATAARACDLVDVLSTNAHHSAAVLNLGHNSWLDDDYTSWPLSRIARQQDIAFTSHDIRWAGSPRFRSDDLLIMSWPELHRFLDGWSLYDIEILDLPGPLEDPEADELALVINTHDNASPSPEQPLGRHCRERPTRPRRNPRTGAQHKELEDARPDPTTSPPHDHP